jgi:hypothetical protein
VPRNGTGARKAAYRRVGELCRGGKWTGPVTSGRQHPAATYRRDIGEYYRYSPISRRCKTRVQLQVPEHRTVAGLRHPANDQSTSAVTPHTPAPPPRCHIEYRIAFRGRNWNSGIVVSAELYQRLYQRNCISGNVAPPVGRLVLADWANHKCTLSVQY